jgi:hypothetical protein
VSGKYNLKDITIEVNGKVIATLPANGSGTYSTTTEFADNSTQTITATVRDEVFYSASGSVTANP